MSMGVLAMLKIDMVILVNVLGKFLDKCDHVTVIYLIGKIVHPQFQNGSRVFVLTELCIVTTEYSFILIRSLHLLVVQLNHLGLA